MSTQRIIRLVAAREVGDRIRNKGFLAGTAVTLLLVVGFIVVPGLFADDTPPTHALGVVGEVDATFSDTATAAATAQDAELEVTSVADRAAAEAAVDDEELDAVLLDGDTVLVADDLDRQLESIIEQARQQTALLGGLADAGVDVDRAGELLAGRPPVQVVTPEGTEDEADSGRGLAFFATVLLFLVIQINGSCWPASCPG